MTSAGIDRLSSHPLNQFSQEVDSFIFEGHELAASWIGMLAVPDQILNMNEMRAAGVMRAQVYTSQGFLHDTEILSDGTERDSDDDRSIHFGVLRNRGLAQRPLLIGTSRLILKRHLDEPLPVESMFPEAFEQEPAGIGSSEASRYIATEGRTTSLSLIRAMASYAYRGGIQPVYAVVEQHLANTFDRISLPYTTVAEPRMIEQYNTVNQAIKINPLDVIKAVDPTNHDISVTADFFKDTLTHQGLGYFDATLNNEV